MTKEELENFEKELQNRGYTKYSAPNNADYAWYKSFGISKLEGERSNYQICFSVWEWIKKTNCSRDGGYFKNNPYDVSPSIMVSRCVGERTDLEVYHTKDIEKIEQLAESFFKWVEDNIKIEQLIR